MNKWDSICGYITLVTLAIIVLSILIGCETVKIVEVPAPKQFDCGATSEDGQSWYCLSRTTDKCIRNEYKPLEECSGINNE